MVLSYDVTFDVNLDSPKKKEDLKENE